jgi:hypothetical protein
VRSFAGLSIPPCQPSLPAPVGADTTLGQNPYDRHRDCAVQLHRESGRVRAF